MIKRNNSSLKNLWSRIDSYRNNCHFTRIMVRSSSIQNLNSIKMHNIILWNLIRWSAAIWAPTPTPLWATSREQDTQPWPQRELIRVVRELQGPLWIDRLDWTHMFNKKEDNMKSRKILRIKLTFKKQTTVETSIQETVRDHCISKR